MSAQPLQELFQTDAVYPQEEGEFQFSWTPTYQQEPEADEHESILSVEYGLTDAWQVELEWTAFAQHCPADEESTCGTGNLEIGTQYSFLNIQDSSFHAALGFSVEFPLGDINRELSDGFVEYEPKLIVARDFPMLHNAQIFAQIGVGFVQRVDRPEDPDEAEPAAHELNWGAGIFVPFSWCVTTLEFSGSNNRWNNHGTENLFYLTPGFIWKPSSHTEIGLGVPVGLNEESEGWGIIGKLTYEF